MYIIRREKKKKQLYWNHTPAWVLSCKFAAYFQNTLSQEHFWVTASVIITSIKETWWLLDRNTKNFAYIQFECGAQFSQPIIKNPYICFFGTCRLTWFSQQMERIYHWKYNLNIWRLIYKVTQLVQISNIFLRAAS